MHIPPIFAEERPAELHKIIRRYPLATLTAVTTEGLEAYLLPLDLATDLPANHPGQLRGHVARNHPLANKVDDGSQLLAVFQSPNAYISPRWYVNGQKSGRIAPSWNYVAVQVRGTIRFVDSNDWVLEHLAALTANQESGRAQPWTLADAAPQFLQEVSARLIGFTIDIDELTGRRMLSQQRTGADRLSLIAHLANESGSAKDLAALIVP